MSSVDKLSIRGIRSFGPDEEQTVHFDRPVTIILGENGCGKTTVIECLKIACTGSLPPGVKGGSAFVHDPDLSGVTEIKASVKVLLRNRVNMHMYVGRHFQVKNKTGKRKEFKALDGVIKVQLANGSTQSQSHKCSDLDATIPAYLGVSKAILDNVIFVHQEESNWPLKEGAELKKKFDDIFESTRYTKALAEISSKAKRLKSDAKDKKIAQVKLEGHVNEFRRLSHDKREAVNSLEEVRETISGYRETCDALETKADAIRSVLDANFALEEGLREKKFASAQLQTRLNTMRTRLNEEYAQTESIAKMSRPKNLAACVAALTSFETAKATERKSRAELEHALKTAQAGLHKADVEKHDVSEEVAVLVSKQESARDLWRELASSTRAAAEACELEIPDALMKTSTAAGSLGLASSSAPASMPGDVSQGTPASGFGEKGSAISAADTFVADVAARAQELQAAHEAESAAARRAYDADSDAVSKIKQRKQAREAAWNASKKEIADNVEETKRKEAELSQLQVSNRTTGLTLGMLQKRVLKGESDLEDLKMKWTAAVSEKVEAEKAIASKMAHVDERVRDAKAKVADLERNSDAINAAKQRRQECEALMRTLKTSLATSTDVLRSCFHNARTNHGWVGTPWDEMVGGVDGGELRDPDLAIPTLDSQTRDLVKYLEDNLAQDEKRYASALQRCAALSGKRDSASAERDRLHAEKDKLRVPKPFKDVLSRRRTQSHPNAHRHDEVPPAEVLRFLEDKIATETREAAVAIHRPELLCAILKSMRDVAAKKHEQRCFLCKQDVSEVTKRNAGDDKEPFLKTLAMDPDSGEIARPSDPNDDAYVYNATYTGVDAVGLHVHKYIYGPAVAKQRDAAQKLLTDLREDRAELAAGLPAFEKWKTLTARLDALDAELEGDIAKELDAVKAERDRAEIKVARLKESLVELQKERHTFSTALSYKLERYKTMTAAVENDAVAAVGSSGTTLSEARAALERLYDEAAQLRSEREYHVGLVQEARDKYDEQNATLAALREDASRAEEKSSRETALRNAIATLAERRTAALAEKDGFSTEVSRLESELSTQHMLRAQSERARSEAVEAARKKAEAARAAHTALDNVVVRFRKYLSRNVAATLITKQKRLSELECDLKERAQAHSALAAKKDKLAARAAKATVVENVLLAEKDAFEIEEELEALRVKIEEDTATLAGSPTKSLDAGGRAPRKTLAGLDAELDALKLKIAGSEGEATVLNTSVNDLNARLAKAELRHIQERYRDASVECSAVEMCVRDLEKYKKALDAALMRFHTGRIEEINKRIKELWSSCYTGGDIESLEIKAEASKSRGVQSYNYRLVMRRCGAELDMRGRCSAGQKVLASIVIRLALAECFSAECAMLSLDEPTTNLDHPNKLRLAEALGHLIEAKKGTPNFELLIITHDEAFVEGLAQNPALGGSANALPCYQVARIRGADGRYTSRISRVTLGGGVGEP